MSGAFLEGVTMKKIKKALLSILAAALILTCTTAVAIIALPADHTAETKEEPEIETSPKPLVINIPKEQFGKIIIHLDEEVLYEYEGPIKVERSAGEYKVEAHTGTCSCFDDNDNNTTEW